MIVTDKVVVSRACRARLRSKGAHGTPWRIFLCREQDISGQW